ncbi:TetR family transcriptional regulator [Solirubrobacter pauli]|uniref:TetR family transcriptional regulator n=1 Tax=Solirubrobacter pauli TaxID=166793 RepID=A0A660KWS7_9ACTN|nr:TetR/AcrR family transcriptional regulator [Solirubrobacter pauli]RKQ86181.1 TetR family transcriptional regulator [Solirubrobacter pauli]
MESLRERKKAATRQAISDVATRLFERHGFEAVTLAQVAAAANVAPKTIWNYFGSKEELFFDAEPAVLERLVAAVAAGESLRPLLDRPVLAGPCTWADLDGPLLEGIRGFLACERASPTLRARRTTLTHGWGKPLGAAAGGQVRGALLAAVILLRHETVAEAVLEELPAEAVRRRVSAVLDDALDVIG